MYTKKEMYMIVNMYICLIVCLLVLLAVSIKTFETKVMNEMIIPDHTDRLSLLIESQ